MSIYVQNKKKNINAILRRLHLESPNSARISLGHIQIIVR